MESYICAVCGKQLKSGEVHDHYVEELSLMFAKGNLKVIQEGKIPKAFCKGWCEPDLFIIDNLKLVKIVEVIVGDNYETGERSVHNKCQKIRNYYEPFEIIVFEPTDYLDKEHLPDTKASFIPELGYEPESYKQIPKHFHEKWKREGLNVSFWNEENLNESKEEEE